MKRILIVLAVVAMAFAGSAAYADAIGFDTGTPAGSRGFNQWSTGYQFLVTSPITIDKLLLADIDSDGFVGVGIVNIYNDDGTSVLADPNLSAAFFGTSQTVFAGDTPAGGVWRQFDVIDTVLGPGTYTIIAGLIDNDDKVWHGMSSITPALNSIFYGESRSTNGFAGAGVNPTTNVKGNALGYFGPNFTVLVPTPAAALMALPIFAGLIIARRRRMA